MVTTRVNINDSEKEHNKNLDRKRNVITQASMSMSQISNCRVIEVDRFRTNHRNIIRTGIDHFRRLLNYRQKGRKARRIIFKKNRRQRRHYTKMRGRKIGELNNICVECIYYKSLKL